MSAHNKVVWSEGLFLQPQHFQQQDRYFERYVEQRCHALVPYSWGFTEVELERDLLAIGKLGLKRASGCSPTVTPIGMPDDDPLPPPLDLDVQVRDQVVYLAVPLRREGTQDVNRTPGPDGLTRHHVRDWETRDATRRPEARRCWRSAPREGGSFSRPNGHLPTPASRWRT